jgi:hypothetical protein
MVKLQVQPVTQHQAAPATGLPISAERYISPAWLAREAEELWTKVWMFACLERDVAEPGSFHVFDIGRESIIVSRSDTGLHAFYNSSTAAPSTTSSSASRRHRISGTGQASPPASSRTPRTSIPADGSTVSKESSTEPATPSLLWTAASIWSAASW